MKPERKEKWLKALRSGEYKQGYGRLQRNNSYCCLGVLCDLHAKETGNSWGDGYDKIYLGERCYPPQAVRDWAGLEDKKGYFCTDFGAGNLVDFNDSGESFQAISDIIEKNF